jgi:CDP-diglyceride synthetase
MTAVHLSLHAILRIALLYVSVLLLVGTGLFVANRKQASPVQRKGRIAFIVLFCIATCVLVAALVGHWIFSAVIAAIALLGGYEIYRVTRASIKPPLAAIAIVLYLLLGAAAVLFAWRAPTLIAVFVFLVVCAFDGFSLVASQLFGGRPLDAKIDSGKTKIGTFVGLLLALGAALLLDPATGLSPLQSVITCFYIVMAALLGDTLATLLKRSCKVTSFGHLLPDGTGILDRFSSFLFASVACFVFGAAGYWLVSKIHPH